MKDMFDMEQYEKEEEKFIDSLDLGNDNLTDDDLTEEEIFLDNLLNEHLDTIDLIKER